MPEDNKAALALLNDQARYCIQNYLSLFATFGCAISWHLPHRPFSKRSPAYLPWINLHYGSDVLASALRHQGLELSHVEDIELPYKDHAMIRRCEWIDFCYALVKQYVLSWVSATPFSHMMYFIDDQVYDILHHRIQRVVAMRQKGAWPSISSETAAVRKEDSEVGFESSVEPVRLECLLRVKDDDIVSSFDEPSVNAEATNWVFVYVHGMSTPDLIATENAIVQSCFAKCMDAVSRQVGTAKLQYSLYSLTYHHLMDKDKHIRMTAYDRPPAPSPYAKPRGRNRWQAIKDMVMTRFPIAMAYWTEKQVRDQIHEAIRDILEPLCRSSTGRPTRVVVLAYSAGCLVATRALGEWHEESQEYQGSMRLNKVDGLVTVGNPINWFGDVGSFALPSWSSDERWGWFNFCYQRDVTAVPLKPSHRVLNDRITGEVVLEKHESYLSCGSVMTGTYLSTMSRRYIRALFPRWSRDGGVTWLEGVLDCWRWAVSKVGVNEWTACLNGAYLDDKSIWQAIENRILHCMKASG